MKAIRLLFVALCLALVSPAWAVDINSADAKTLAAELRGVGPKTAQRIVQYRQQNGPFKSADDLAKVKGIGKKTLEKNRTKISLGKQ